MTTDENKIYKFVLEKEVVTASRVARKFSISEEQALEVLETLSRQRLIKADLITNVNEKERIKLFKSPLTDELDNLNFISFN